MHAIAELTLPSVRSASEAALLKQYNEFRHVRAKNKSEEEIKKLETYRDRITIKKLKGVDQ